MSKKKVIPATSNRMAIIRLTSMQKAKIARIIPEIFLKPTKYPENIRLIIADDEVLSEAARQQVKGNILEISFQR
jgi:hypothetical protein